ncbi:MAG: methyl-accepting chemotaxis protein, partial [Arcobacteraceae bacterium]|nr:methyl-accepting chemotaxis protein [Arcobacteraceae bacterium]
MPEVSHKQKMFINMLIAQFGFLSLTLIMVFYEGNIKIAIVANVIFAVLIAYLGWAAFRRVNEGVDVFNLKMHALIDYAFMRTNRMANIKYKHNDEIGWILDEFDKFTDKFDSVRKDDMKVLGEIVLVLNKVEQGIYQCNVKSTSSNFMIQELARSVNKMINITRGNIVNIKDVLSDYTHDNFRQNVIISELIKSDLLSVMQSVNKLGEALRTNAKLNLSNGETLNHNAITMSESVNNVAAKANQQAASLEETAAALE